jgi:hypothetical protein
MSKTKRHYTFEDIESAIEDEHARLVTWRCEALRELRACLFGGAQESPRPSAGAKNITWKKTTGKASAIA